MCFGRKHLEIGSSYSHELATYLKYHKNCAKFFSYKDKR